MVAKNPVWQLEDDEAKKLAQAIKGVLKYHQIPVSPQMLAYIQLLGVSGVVYGPRIGLTLMAGKAKKEQAKKAQAQQKQMEQAQAAPAQSMAPAGVINFDTGMMQ